MLDNEAMELCMPPCLVPYDVPGRPLIRGFSSCLFSFVRPCCSSAGQQLETSQLLPITDVIF